MIVGGGIQMSFMILKIIFQIAIVVVPIGLVIYFVSGFTGGFKRMRARYKAKRNRKKAAKEYCRKQFGRGHKRNRCITMHRRGKFMKGRRGSRSRRRKDNTKEKKKKRRTSAKKYCKKFKWGAKRAKCIRKHRRGELM